MAVKSVPPAPEYCAPADPVHRQRRQHAIDGQVLMLQTDSRQLLVVWETSFRVDAQARATRTSRVSAVSERAFTASAYWSSSCFSSPTRGPRFAAASGCIEIPAPGARQLKHTDGAVRLVQYQRRYDHIFSAVHDWSAAR